MRNCAKKIRSQLFVFCQDGRLFFLMGIFLIFHGKSTFSQNRKKNIVFGGIQRLFAGCNPHHSVNRIIYPDSQIKTFGIGKRLGGSACVTVVFKHPFSHCAFISCEIIRGGIFFTGRKCHGSRQGIFFRRIDHNISVQKFCKLMSRRSQNRVTVCSLLKYLTGIKQNLCTKGCTGRLTGNRLHPCGKCSGQKG